MFELDAFAIRGHEKVIDQYRWLQDSSMRWSASDSRGGWIKSTRH